MVDSEAAYLCSTPASRRTPCDSQLPSRMFWYRSPSSKTCQAPAPPWVEAQMVLPVEGWLFQVAVVEDQVSWT